MCAVQRKSTPKPAALTLAATLAACSAPVPRQNVDYHAFVLLGPEGRAVVRVIDVMTFDDAGRFTSMRAFWGPSDMEMQAA